MADLALAPATPAAASPIAAMLTATHAAPANGAAPVATDPFAILMAAAAPTASKALVTTPLSDEPKSTAVAEKTDDGETAKDDSDQTNDSDALLALLTTPAPLATPMPIAPPTAPPTPVSDTPDAPVAKAAAPITPPAALAQTTAPAPDTASAAPTTQTSIQALVQMMTAQADPVTVPRPIAAQAVVQPEAQPAAGDATAQPLAAGTLVQAASPLVAAPAVASARAQAAPAAIADAKPLTRANARFLSPKLDDARPATAKALPERRAAKAEGADAKQPRRANRDADTRTDAASPQPQPQETKVAPRDTATVTANGADIGSTDAVVTRHLAVAQDGQWLDSLAKDIAATGGNNSRLSFTLSPENLGALKVDITQGSDGASVHMTTDNDTARNIILDAQPRLAAEARAQGLTLKETSVSTNSDSQRQAPAQQQASAQSNHQQQGQDRRAFAQVPQQPTAPHLSSPADESDGELYA